MCLSILIRTIINKLSIKSQRDERKYKQVRKRHKCQRDGRFLGGQSAEKKSSGEAKAKSASWHRTRKSDKISGRELRFCRPNWRTGQIRKIKPIICCLVSFCSRLHTSIFIGRISCYTNHYWPKLVPLKFTSFVKNLGKIGLRLQSGQHLPCCCYYTWNVVLYYLLTD